jgi:unsaturated rhamnogalacturonyl hydrolase
MSAVTTFGGAAGSRNASTSTGGLAQGGTDPETVSGGETAAGGRSSQGGASEQGGASTAKGGSATSGGSGPIVAGTTARGGTSYTGPDWSVRVVDSTMTRTPNLRGWGYWNGFFLSAVYRVYLRTKDARYLQYIRSWADAAVDGTGKVNTNITSLDLIQPGLVLMQLHEATKVAKYKTAADSIRKIFDTYPTTSDGGFWHMTKGTAANRTLGINQLWLDGTYMSTPFLVKYGTLIGAPTENFDVATKQLAVTAAHLKDAKTGLFYHAYDVSGTARWADPTTHRSSEFWGRSIGWYGMAMIEVLDALPADHAGREAIVQSLSDLVAGLARYQSASGLWYQVVDKGERANNWLETSSSSMFAYIISKAVENGYVAASYGPVAIKGFQGVLTKISMAAGTTSLTGICEGTDVGDYNYYIGRRRLTNDMHGLGAFLVMSEQMMK